MYMYTFMYSPKHLCMPLPFDCAFRYFVGLLFAYGVRAVAVAVAATPAQCVARFRLLDYNSF